MAPLLALALLVGCSGRGGRSQAEALGGWLRTQSYSGWNTFKQTAHTPHAPDSPDGITLGSPNVFAAIGCNDKDLTSVDVLWMDRRRVRPLGKALTVAVRRGGGTQPQALADFPSQVLRRVRHSAIAVSESLAEDLRVNCVDFAPMSVDDNFLVRWFLVENRGKAALSVGLVFDIPAAGDWQRKGSRVWGRGERLAVVSDLRLGRMGDKLEAGLGRLRPGERRAAALAIVAARQPREVGDYSTRAAAALADPMGLLEATRSEWEEWCLRVPLTTGRERVDDLLDSLLCLLLTHVGTEAVHTGSLRYPHSRAWVRDNYWVGRALLELGRVAEARRNLDFLHRAWQRSGLASCYEIPGGEPRAWGYQRVELPHYLVLMVRDAERLGGLDGRAYWDMVQGCLDAAAVPESGLQPMNGDETWLLAAPVRELDCLLDNSWLLIASAEYGAELAARAGDAERSARYQSAAYRARKALERFLPRASEAEWYATGVGGDGSRDFSLCPGVLARGAVLGVLPASDPYLETGLIQSWQRLGFRGGVRAHARSATIDGGTPGYLLYAAADSPACGELFVRDLAMRLLSFCSATGCVWEFHDLHDPAWGGEKRRLWDSAVVLMGLTRALFEAQRDEEGISFVPRVRTAGARAGEALESALTPEEAENLLTRSGEALILHDGGREHAARVARELLRQMNHQYAIAPYAGAPPKDHSAIVISRNPPGSGWRRSDRGYWVRGWEGPTQVWVLNKGDVYRDTDPLLTDLLSGLTPARERPLPYPDASLDVAQRLGEPPSGEAEVSAVSGARRSGGRLRLRGGKVSLEAGGARISVQAGYDAAAHLLKLSVNAAGPRPATTVSATLPAGWWLVRARDMTGKWDRVEDPVVEVRLPNGGLRLDYSLRRSEEPLYLTFDLARLAPSGD